MSLSDGDSWEKDVGWNVKALARKKSISVDLSEDNYTDPATFAQVITLDFARRNNFSIPHYLKDSPGNILGVREWNQFSGIVGHVFRPIAILNSAMLLVDDK